MPDGETLYDPVDRAIQRGEGLASQRKSSGASVVC